MTYSYFHDKQVKTNRGDKSYIDLIRQAKEADNENSIKLLLTDSQWKTFRKHFKACRDDIEQLYLENSHMIYDYFNNSVSKVEILMKTMQKSPFAKNLQGEIADLNFFIVNKNANKLTELKITLEKILAKFSILEDTVIILEDNRHLKYSFVYAVKLPSFELFDDVAEFTKHLNQIFSIVLTDNKKAKLVGFDKGSEWYQNRFRKFSGLQDIRFIFSKRYQVCKGSFRG